MGSMSRKFLNLIVKEHTPGFKSLRCIDLTRTELFYDAPPPPPPAPADGGDGSTTMGTLLLPSPSYTFRPGDSDASDEWAMHCFPLGDRKVVCADQSGLAFALDAETRVVGTMRSFRTPKRTPLSLATFLDVTVRNQLMDPDIFSSLFVMERFAEPEAKHQFEAFFTDSRYCGGSGYWTRRLLPQPPFVGRNRKKSSGGTPGGPVEITAYTVVGRGSGSSVQHEWVDKDAGAYYFKDGSCICVSAAGAGTYCLDAADTQTWKWTQVGQWMLPFHGKAEYVPELKLWFGFSAESRRLAAADLSGMDSLCKDQEPPRVVGTWQELDHPPEEWRECRDPQLVRLGSGRFCVARFFQTTTTSSDDDDGETAGEEDFAVLTGVEVVPPCRRLDDDDSQAAGDDGNGKAMKLRMIKHKSTRLHGRGTIETVF